MNTTIRFEKMHGAGNDFVLIDNRHQNFIPTKSIIQSLSDRHTGIGFDQLLLIQNSDIKQCDASYRFFNTDGSEAEQCGNGQRCISHYLYKNSINQNTFCISGLAGIIQSQINKDKSVTINMGQINTIKTIMINEIECFHVDFGNPHLIHITKNVDEINLQQLNNKLTGNYPNGINFEAVEIIDEKTIKLRVHERGTGETLACGSGACATMAALQYAKIISDNVKVILPGGNLMVEYNHIDNNYFLTGPAVHVFTGEILI
jgi:diaminopimelate epimerase